MKVRKPRNLSEFVVALMVLMTILALMPVLICNVFEPFIAMVILDVLVAFALFMSPGEEY